MGFPAVVVAAECSGLAVDNDCVVRDVLKLHGAFMRESHQDVHLVVSHRDRIDVVPVRAGPIRELLRFLLS